MVSRRAVGTFGSSRTGFNSLERTPFFNSFSRMQSIPISSRQYQQLLARLNGSASRSRTQSGMRTVNSRTRTNRVANLREQIQKRREKAQQSRNKIRSQLLGTGTILASARSMPNLHGEPLESDTSAFISSAEPVKIRSDEQTAAGKLRLAKNLMKRRPEIARKRLQEIVRTFPGTHAALEATQRLSQTK